LLVEFTFVGGKSEHHQIWLVLTVYISKAHICGYNLSKHYLVFDSQPGECISQTQFIIINFVITVLHDVTLNNYDPEERPTDAGTLLTLVCQATGSSNLRFRWTKDGYPIDLGRTSRHLWENRITRSNGEEHISVFNIEKAHRFDEGEYACEVSDWNQTERRALHVHVIPTPHMEVTPLSSTLPRGSLVAITCLSRDDEFALFTYTWQRDGKTLVRGENEEVVEQLLPTGIRLRIPSLIKSARYTCTISSAAGSVSQDSHVQVLNGKMPFEAQLQSSCQQQHLLFHRKGWRVQRRNLQRCELAAN
jgi:hypothetical protein